jgi:AcrR family transcriptional regulator
LCKLDAADLSVCSLAGAEFIKLNAPMDSYVLERIADSKSEALLPPRERLLQTARRLFCRYGINSVGVDAIIGEASTAKTTLYKIFGSKEGLVEAVLDREGETWREWFLGEIDGPGGTALDRLARLSPTLRKWFRQPDFFGCPFINAVAEFDKTDDRMRRLAIAHKTIVLKRIKELCAEASVAEPERTAHTLGLIMDGAIVMALVTRDDSAADLAASACSAVVKERLP